MVVIGGQTSKGYQGLKEGRQIALNDADMNTTKKRYSKNMLNVGAKISAGNINVALGENYISSTLQGVHANYAEIDKKEMLYGRFINELDNEDTRKVMVISESQAKELMPRHIDRLVGRYVKVDSLAYHVIGIYKSDQSEMNADCYAPFNTVRVIYQKGDKVGNVVFAFQGLETEKANKDFEESYRASLNRNHQAAPDDEEAVWIWNRFTQALQMNTGMGIIRTALWVIGIFTLLSGIVGVSNIMLITVKERTREFGIRKAIGAKPSSILKLIIIESVIITTFFGYIGMMMGMVANQIMDATIGHEKIDSGLFTLQMFVNPTVVFDVCVEATLVMVLAGTLAGLIPARKAAHIRPIEALRAE